MASHTTGAMDANEH